MKGVRKAFVLSLLLVAGCPLWGQAELRTAPAAQLRVQVYGGTRQGGFRAGYESSSLWLFGADASGSHRSRRSTYSGSVNYEEQHGSAQMLSMFTEPGYYPFDVMEFTPGDKTRQTYSLSGGFGTQLPSPHWIIGASASIRSTNYSKSRDLRHTTYALSLSLEPSLMYCGSGWALQLGYTHRKKAESIDAEQIGSATDLSYYAFLDKGLDYGAWEVWDGAGVHLDEAGVSILPVTERADGASLLLIRGGLKARISVLATSGLMGEKGFDWMRFPGLEAVASVSGNNWDTSLKLKADELEQAIMDRVNEGGVTLPRIYGYNKVSDRLHLSLEGGATLPVDTWTLTLRCRGMLWNDHSFLSYPWTASQLFFSGSLQAGVRHSFGRLRTEVDLSAGAGRNIETGLQRVSDTVLEEPPYRLQADWDRRMEYLCVPRGGLQLRLCHPLIGPLEIGLDAFWQHGFGVSTLPGADRFGALLRLGIGL